MTQKHWNFQWSDNPIETDGRVTVHRGWSVKIEDRYYALPTPMQLMEDKLAYRADLHRLLELRGRLADISAANQIESCLSPADRNQFTRFLFQGI